MNVWRLPLTAAGWAVLCVALSLTELQAEASDARELSSQEEADLRAGKLVVRPMERRSHGRQWLGGMAWQLIDANVDEVYQALSDTNAHVKYLPAAEEVRLIDPTPPQLLFVRHRLGLISASYFVHTSYDPALHSLRIELDHSRPSAIRDAWAQIQVHPYGRRASIVSLAVMADLGEGLVIGMIRSNVHTWMLRVPMLLKRYIEGRARRQGS